MKLLVSTLIGLSATASFADLNSQLTTSTNNGQVTINANALSVLQGSEATKIDHHLVKREMILRSYGLRVGQQFGYGQQLQYLQSKIEKKNGELNKIFNFKFILSYANENSPAINILPPVLLKAQNFVQNENGQAILISDQHYTLYSQARLVTVVPTWRDYLIHAIPKPQEVTQGFLPHDASEQKVWAKSLEDGWKLGIHQGNEEMEYRINRLSRDYNGMVTYLKLLNEGKVSAPYVAYTHQSVVGNGEAMSVNQNVFRITTQSQLITNPKQWKFLSQEKIK